jgi:hypothetical protein
MRRLRVWLMARSWRRTRNGELRFAELEAEVLSDAVATLTAWEVALEWPEIRDHS